LGVGQNDAELCSKQDPISERIIAPGADAFIDPLVQVAAAAAARCFVHLFLRGCVGCMTGAMPFRLQRGGGVERARVRRGAGGSGRVLLAD
jgi:hypothetical protein